MKRKRTFFNKSICEIRDANREHVSTNGVKELNLVLKKIGEQQFIVGFFLGLSIVFYILIPIQVIFFRYYWFCAIMLVETSCFLAIMLSDLKRTGSHHGSKKQTENETGDTGGSNKAEDMTISSSTTNLNKKMIPRVSIEISVEGKTNS